MAKIEILAPQFRSNLNFWQIGSTYFSMGNLHWRWRRGRLGSRGGWGRMPTRGWRGRGWWGLHWRGPSRLQMWACNWWACLWATPIRHCLTAVMTRLLLLLLICRNRSNWWSRTRLFFWLATPAALIEAPCSHYPAGGRRGWFAGMLRLCICRGNGRGCRGFVYWRGRGRGRSCLSYRTCCGRRTCTWG